MEERPAAVGWRVLEPPCADPAAGSSSPLHSLPNVDKVLGRRPRRLKLRHEHRAVDIGHHILFELLLVKRGDHGAAGDIHHQRVILGQH